MKSVEKDQVEGGGGGEIDENHVVAAYKKVLCQSSQ